MEIKAVRMELVPRERIKIGERFRIDFGAITDLADSMREKGILQSVTVDADYNLLAGGRRMAAAEIAGIDMIPCIVRDVEGELDAREIELIENVMRKDMSWSEKAALTAEIDRLYKRTNQEWSQRKTAQLLNRSIGGVNRHIQLAEAVQAVPELAGCKTEDEAVKLIKKATKQAEIREARAEQAGRVKDISILKHADKHFRIGDAFAGIDELIEIYESGDMQSNIGLIEVDPPYGIELNDVKKGDEKHERYTEVDPDEYKAWLRALCSKLHRVAARDAWVIFWFGPTWFCEVKSALLEAGFKVDDIPAIWTKGNGQTNCPDIYLARAYEPFFIARKGNPKINKQGRSNIFSQPPLAPSMKWHPTQRPIPLMYEVLDTFYMPGKTCMIPFLGSGSTLAACYQLHIPAFGWDLAQENKDCFMLMVEKELGGLDVS